MILSRDMIREVIYKKYDFQMFFVCYPLEWIKQYILKTKFNEATENNDEFNIQYSLLLTIIGIKVVLMKISCKYNTNVHQWKLLSDAPMIHTQ